MRCSCCPGHSGYSGFIESSGKCEYVGLYITCQEQQGILQSLLCFVRLHMIWNEPMLYSLVPTAQVLALALRIYVTNLNGRPGLNWIFGLWLMVFTLNNRIVWWVDDYYWHVSCILRYLAFGCLMELTLVMQELWCTNFRTMQASGQYMSDVQGPLRGSRSYLLRGSRIYSLFCCFVLYESLFWLNLLCVHSPL